MMIKNSKIPMKIIQVNCVYNTGSTGKIVYDIHTELKNRGIESIVCYGRGQKTTDEGVYKTCGELYSKFNNLCTRINGVMYGGCFFSTNRLISMIKKEQPDIVHLHCINGYFVNIYRLVEFLKKNRIKTVLTLHAEFMHTANCGYAFDCERFKIGCGNCPRLRKETKSLFFDHTHTSWNKMKQAFDGFDDLIVTSVSPWLMERAKQSPILADKRHFVVMNGLNTDIFHIYDTSALRKKHGIADEKIIFHATPFFTDDPEHIKGGCYVIELAKKMSSTKFIVAGDHLVNLSVPDNVILLGRISDQKELAKYYSMADLTLLTSQRETFSMICAESLCCGTPVVGFKAGGPEMITIPEFSAFVHSGDVKALKSIVLRWLNIDIEKQLISREAAAWYSRKKMTTEYIGLYKEVLKRFDTTLRFT